MFTVNLIVTLQFILFFYNYVNAYFRAMLI